MKICFVGPSYSALKGHPEGGSERQIGLLAHALSYRDHDVSMVLTGIIPDKPNAGKVKVIPAWRPKFGIKCFRFFTYQLPSLYKVLLEVDANVYYTRGFSLFAPVVVSAAKRLNAVSIVALASDTDLIPNEECNSSRGYYEKLQYSTFARKIYLRYALHRADYVSTQTEGQAHICSQLRLNCTKIPNIVDIPEKQRDVSPQVCCWDVTWIGHFSLRKGIRELLTLAEDLSEYSFCVVGSLKDKCLLATYNKMKTMRNVTARDELSHEEVQKVISQSKVVINTSPVEGFSNVFLEAWALEKPVISLNANPDSLLSTDSGCGFCADGKIELMADVIRKELSNPEERKRNGIKAREYVTRIHSTKCVCSRIEKLYFSMKSNSD